MATCNSDEDTAFQDSIELIAQRMVDQDVKTPVHISEVPGIIMEEGC